MKAPLSPSSLNVEATFFIHVKFPKKTVHKWRTKPTYVNEYGGNETHNGRHNGH